MRRRRARRGRLRRCAMRQGTLAAGAVSGSDAELALGRSPRCCAIAFATWRPPPARAMGRPWCPDTQGRSSVLYCLGALGLTLTPGAGEVAGRGGAGRRARRAARRLRRGGRRQRGRRGGGAAAAAGRVSRGARAVRGRRAGGRARGAAPRSQGACVLTVGAATASWPNHCHLMGRPCNPEPPIRIVCLCRLPVLCLPMDSPPGPGAPQALLDASEGAHGAAALLALTALARGVAARRAAAPRGEGGGGEGGAAAAAAALVPPEGPSAPFRRLAPLLQARGEHGVRRSRAGCSCVGPWPPLHARAPPSRAAGRALSRSDQFCGGSVLATGQHRGSKRHTLSEWQTAALGSRAHGAHAVAGGAERPALRERGRRRAGGAPAAAARRGPAGRHRRWRRARAAARVGRGARAARRAARGGPAERRAPAAGERRPPGIPTPRSRLPAQPQQRLRECRDTTQSDASGSAWRAGCALV